jgi:hypothetical protein
MSTEMLDRAERPDDEAEEFSREVVFEMLSNQRRRYVIHRLLDADEEVELRELSRLVAAWENGKDPDDITPKERRRAYNALQQAHLPKMDDAGLVEFNASRGTVAAGDDLDDLQVYLEIVPGNEISWSQYYVLLGAFGASLSLATGVGVPPFDRIPGVLLAGAIALLFVVSGLAHVYHGRKTRLGADGNPPTVDV